MTEPSTASSKIEKKRVQIRSAAKQLFLDNGFQATTTDAIMSAAGIASKETLYRYYPSKEDLFVDIVRSLTFERPPLEQLMTESCSPKNREELRNLLQVLVLEVLQTMLQPDYLAMTRVIIAELPRFPQLGILFRHTVPEQAMHYLLTLLGNGQANGVVAKNKDLEVIGRMVLGTLLTFAIFDGLLQNNPEPQMPQSSTIEAIVENIMTLICVN